MQNFGMNLIMGKSMFNLVAKLVVANMVKLVMDLGKLVADSLAAAKKTRKNLALVLQAVAKQLVNLAQVKLVVVIILVANMVQASQVEDKY